MRGTFLAAMAAAILCACASVPDSSLPVNSGIEVIDTELTDQARGRVIPIRIYLPRGNDRLRLILFSPGLGNSQVGYSYLGRAWAEERYAAVFLSHPDSDDTLSKGDLYRAAWDVRVWRNRPLDVSFVLDQFLAPASDLIGSIAPRIDFDHVGVAGHSYGAYTALALAGGLVMVDGRRESLADPRFVAMALLSPPRMRAIATIAAYDPIRIPALHLTGTRDRSLVFATPPRIRRVPFESITRSEQFLVTFSGARHGSFSDHGFPRDPLRYHDEIAAFTTAFWDVYLSEDSSGLDRMEQLASPYARFESKMPPHSPGR